jgi:imidazolonepropionase
VAELDLLITHAVVATVAGPDGPRSADAMDVPCHAGWAVGVVGDRIAYVGPAAKAPKAQRVMDAKGKLVTPGYVDAHTHLIYAGDRAFEVAMRLSGRSYLDILQAGGGIAYTAKATRDASVEDLVAAARPRLLRMMHNGTTTLEAKSGYAFTTAGELRMLEAASRLAQETGVRMAHTFLGAHAIPSDYKQDPERYVRIVIEEMLPAVVDQGIATACDVFVEEGVFTIEQGERILDAARQAGLRRRLHADEIKDLGGAALAARCGCDSADHLLAVSPAGIQALAASRTTAVLLPTVPITLMAPRWAPGKALLGAGVPVALASDHNPNNPITDMGLVAQLGCFLLGLSPQQALTAVTHNAAASLGMEDVGSLVVGKRADVLIHDVADLDHWVYEIGRSTVRHVVLGGRLVR